MKLPERHRVMLRLLVHYPSQRPFGVTNTGRLERLPADPSRCSGGGQCELAGRVVVDVVRNRYRNVGHPLVAWESVQIHYPHPVRVLDQVQPVQAETEDLTATEGNRPDFGADRARPARLGETG